MTIDAARPRPVAVPAESAPATAWWRTAAIYQVYVRSFADGNGDGIGDLQGVRERLGHLSELGVDAIWFTPWYASPLADGGYDVEDYRAIHPDFGDIAEAELLIAEAAARGIRCIVDIVPNHLSSRHRWFQEALASPPGSEARARFWFRDGLGEHGEIQPNQWPSSFAGSTWTRTTDPDGSPGQWYLHLFTPEQPDLNWNHPDVRREHEEVLRFWFDRGVAGVRIDSAALVMKDPTLAEIGDVHPVGAHPNLDRDELHELYRSWRALADDYEDARLLVGEVWLADVERFALYLRPDELHMAFNFDFMSRPWDAAGFRESIDDTIAAHRPMDAPPTWVLSNHDVTRPVTRYGRADSGFAFATKRFGTPTDLELGDRRARAAALITGALPGALYIYQGDELGLPEVEDLPLSVLDDPMHFRSDGVDPGRDGCRVPLPWSGTSAPYGFSPPQASADTWLPQPPDWASRTADAQRADPASMLSLYRTMLSLRRAFEDEAAYPFRWVDESDGRVGHAPPDGVLAFERGGGFRCIANLSTDEVALPPNAAVLLVSTPLTNGMLPPDAAAWLRMDPPPHP